MGGRFVVNDATETPDTMEAMLEYPGLLVSFSLRPEPPPGFKHMGDIGCVFEGSEARSSINYSKHEVWVKGKQVENFPRPAPTIPDSPGHLREFLDAIKARNIETTCNVRYGHRLTKLGLLSNIAFRTGGASIGTTSRSASSTIAKRAAICGAASGRTTSSESRNPDACDRNPCNSARRPTSRGRSRHGVCRRVVCFRQRLRARAR